MRCLVVLACLLSLGACVSRAGREKLVLACWRGEPGACRDHARAEQANIDASAIMLGIRLSASRDTDMTHP